MFFLISRIDSFFLFLQVVCLTQCSSAYTNTDLPTIDFLGPTAFVFWTDLLIRSRTTQKIFYRIFGFVPNRTTTIEFQMTRSTIPNSFYHFQIEFFENFPNLIRFNYLNLTEPGNFSTIGLQSSSSGSFIKYSFNQPVVSKTNFTLTFDTNRNIQLG